MKLNEKESLLIAELIAQEQLCIQKYNFYAKNAHDPELKKLFKNIEAYEKNHLEMLKKLQNGTMPRIKNHQPEATKYEPKKSHTGTQEEKEFDKFLCTDIIAIEKYVSIAYNDNLFYFASTEVRNILNAIMTDEQNHAEMIWKYKVANQMTD